MKIKESELRDMILEALIEEGFLDRARAKLAGLAKSGTATVAKGAAKAASRLSGQDVAYQGEDPKDLKMAARLASRLKGALKTLDKLDRDLNLDMEALGIDDSNRYEIQVAFGNLERILKSLAKDSLYATKLGRN
jgi:hypothetical protein